MTKFKAITAAFVGAFAAATLLAGPAAADDGEKAFKKNRCASCHKVTGKHAVGPSLKGVIGRKAGTAEGFKRYSKNMKAAGEKGLVWTEENIDKFITNPKAFLKTITGSKKTKMGFAGLKKADQRKLVIGYLAAHK